MSSALDEFDEVIHPPRRLAICAFLASVDQAEFGAVRDSLSISDSSLSKQLKLLTEAGYVHSEKSSGPGRQRLWLALTSEGRVAFQKHVAQLRRVLETAME